MGGGTDLNVPVQIRARLQLARWINSKTCVAIEHGFANNRKSVAPDRALFHRIAVQRGLVV